MTRSGGERDGNSRLHRLSRRAFLTRAGLVVGGVAAGAVAGVAGFEAIGARDTAEGGTGGTESFFGAHQAGVRTSAQEHAMFLGFTLNDGVTRTRFADVMRMLSDDASHLARGAAPLPDNDPTLTDLPARLTITFGFSRSLLTKLGLQSQIPQGFVDIPGYSVDQLDQKYCGGDLLIQVCSDDPLTLSHAARQMSRTVASFMTPRWSQRGFVGKAGASTRTGTPRNLMGQLDGTVNPGRFGVPFEEFVWSRSAGWFAGGTMMVLRRIAMNLPTWDKLDFFDKEAAIGRKLDSGAPLTGRLEEDSPQFDATGANGLPVIPLHSHIRLAAPRETSERFLRRPYSYDDGLNSEGVPQTGLLFAAYVSDIETQYIPVQNRLAKSDQMNLWTTAIGSATFLIPPGCTPGGFVGEGLLA